MDNQHRKIKSYRELNLHEIAGMNTFKDLENAVAAAFEVMAENPNIEIDTVSEQQAREHLRTGFMYAVRAIAKPESKL